MSENKITFPVKLASNNPQSFGIVDATEISGHKSVDTLSDLYSISDSVLSVLKDGSDAIGQEWFVVSEDCKYRLDNWGNRKSVTGWTKLPKQELINTKQSVSEKDQPSGYAGLDSIGKIPIEKTYGTTATVVDVATYEKLPATGLNGVIYNVLNTGAQYKWSGSAYIDITDGADNAKKNETSIFDCSNGTSTKYYSSLSAAINVVPPVYRTSNRIISYLSTENSTTSAVNYQYHGIDSTTWTDLTKWERIPNQADLAEIRSDLSEKASKNNLKYLVLSYNTDAATTRKLVLSEYRCSGLIVSYNTGSKWITELYTGTSFTDTDWASNSNWKAVGEILTTQGLNLYELQDPDGAVIMAFDEKGRLYSKYVPESIQIEAISGLDSNLNRLNEVSLSKESNSNIFELKDDLGNLFAFIDADGIFDIPRLRVNNLDFHGEQFDDTSFVKDTTVVFPELKFFKINIEGQLAWDSSNLTSVDNVATFYTADNKQLAKFKTKHSIQGASSAGGHLKKGYTLDLFNNDWNPVELKIGNMIPVDSYHTKAFWGDSTHTRDVGNGRFYYEIAKTRKYPNNLVRNVITTIPTAFNNKTSAVEDASFASNGIPFAMYHHGVFFGLYTFRLKKTRLNYALDNKNENHIFIDSWDAGVALGNQSYADFDEIATKYELRSPKKITTNVKANVERFFSYMREVYNGTKDLATTYQDYIILDAWIDWKIQAEIIGHWDSVTNNAAYITYDGLKWWPVMADTDNTLGLRAYTTPITTSTQIYIYKDIWGKFNATFLPQIKARYKELRDNGIISDASAKKIFGGISENIPYYVYEQDFAKWGSWSGSPIIMDSLYTFYHNRMNYLDSIWMD